MDIGTTKDYISNILDNCYLKSDCVEVLEDGAKKYYRNGLLHRDNDLPAVELVDGDKFWYQNGELHRDNDLPAVIYPSGTKYWYKNGKLHRDNDLPAIIVADNGNKEWYKNGKLHRDNDLPAVDSPLYKKWCKNGQLHRDNNLPAIEWYDGYYSAKYWYKNDYLHRDNGPAIDRADGIKEYWYNGKKLDITTDDELRVLIKTGFTLL